MHFVLLMTRWRSEIADQRHEDSLSATCHINKGQINERANPLGRDAPKGHQPNRVKRIRFSSRLFSSSLHRQQIACSRLYQKNYLLILLRSFLPSSIQLVISHRRANVFRSKSMWILGHASMLPPTPENANLSIKTKDYCLFDKDGEDKEVITWTCSFWTFRSQR